MALVVNAVGRHTATVIVHHGFGATATDWHFLARSAPTALAQIKWIFPQAPLRPVTIANGELIPAWFDILKSHAQRIGDGDEDEPGMVESIKALENGLIANEVKNGIATNRIVVAGFSQGAGLAILESAIGHVDDLAGIVLLSGYLPLAWKFKMRDTTTPVLWCHGKADTVIDVAIARKGVAALRAQGVTVDAHEYPGMGHSYCDNELDRLYDWLTTHLPPLAEPASKM